YMNASQFARTFNHKNKQLGGSSIFGLLHRLIVPAGPDDFRCFTPNSPNELKAPAKIQVWQSTV
ncbi:hypothetical protein, partial [Leucothrix pacifica]|uniref:hypothetical protein n=1 Tax=Leucothrix pacifica TaxID=1247513 RepID=UPI001C63C990